MQLILMQDVPRLGSLGDEVHVKDGFARNYLLPRGMAILASRKNSREVEHHRSKLDQLRATAIESAKAESEKVAALVLQIRAKAGVNGKLFGSVTNRDLQALLSEQGYELDRRSIQLHTLIKSVGTFTATVKLHTDVKVDISIKVEPLEGAEGKLPADGEEVDSAASEAVSEGAEQTAQEETSGAADQAQTEGEAPEGGPQQDGEAAATEASPEPAQEDAPAQDASPEETGAGSEN